MKYLTLLLLMPFLLSGQESAEEKSHFVALYTVGSLWDMDKAPNDQAYFKEHSAFLSKLRKENTIVMGARYSDTGMIVLQATDLDSAKNILFEDVALQNQLFNVEVHPFSVFYKGCFD
ncbi:YciI family protein [Flagellimonas iocasae]|uniref:YciI family protein n=1 Tax=Flagellimonas iocasae TaxID=2055905 RepID=A0ABW4XY00_9FLAO